jgi:hypothetical protein
MKVPTNEKEENIVPLHLHFLVVWTLHDTLFFQTFCSKKRKSDDQRKTNEHKFVYLAIPQSTEMS